MREPLSMASYHKLLRKAFHLDASYSLSRLRYIAYREEHSPLSVPDKTWTLEEALALLESIRFSEQKLYEQSVAKSSKCSVYFNHIDPEDAHPEDLFSGKEFSPEEIDDMLEKLDRRLSLQAELEERQNYEKGALRSSGSSVFPSAPPLPNDRKAGYQIFLFKCILYRSFTSDAEKGLDDVSASLPPEMSLFTNIVHSLSKGDLRPFSVKTARRFLVNRFTSCLSTSTFTFNDLENLCLFYQMFYFFEALAAVSEKSLRSSPCRSAADDAEAALFFALAKMYAEQSLIKSAVPLFKRALCTTDPLQCQLSVMILGAYAIDYDPQLAYDAYFSWTSHRVVGEMQDISNPELFLKNSSFAYDANEKAAQNEYDSQQATIFSNFSYVCAQIGDTYEYSNHRHHYFYNAADQYIKSAIAFNKILSLSSAPSAKQNMEAYCTQGTLLSCHDPTDSDLKAAFRNFQIYQAHLTSPIEKADALRMLCHTQVQLCFTLFFEKSRASEFTAAARALKDQLSRFNKAVERLSPTEKNSDTLDSVRNILPYWSTLLQLDALAQKSKDTALLDSEAAFIAQLAMVQYSARELLDSLCRHEYRKQDYYLRDSELDRGITGTREKVVNVAYYTKLSTVSHLFETQTPTNLKSISNAQNADALKKNCLTVMHAKYMNDPHEGLALLNAIQKGFASVPNPENGIFKNHSAETFREGIYQDNFVFLKSFTEQIDRLVMWNRYGSDYTENGRDCNGCCVQLDPETFDVLTKEQGESDADDPVLKKFKDSDDFSLYRVVYLDSAGKISPHDNPGLLQATDFYYDALRQLLSHINNMLCSDDFPKIFGSNADTARELTQKLLRNALRFVIFLFKDNDYAEERESRMLLMREPTCQDRIDFVSRDPKLMCIYPNLQIYVSSLIFGPNVDSADRWVPFFQYNLNQMWKSHPDLKKDSCIEPQSRYTIRKSNIPYHT